MAKGKANTTKLNVAAAALRNVLPVGYVELVQSDMAKRRKHVYSKAMISTVANGGNGSPEILESILNVVRAHQAKQRKLSKSISRVTRKKARA